MTANGKIGRPSLYSEELTDEICDRIATGQSLNEICRSDDMPCTTSVFKWLANYDEFADKYARAREAGVEALAEEMLEIADDCRNDWMERVGEAEGVGWRENGEAIRRSALRVDTRKWLMVKFAPKKYGDKVQLDGNVNVTNEVSDMQFARMVAFTLDKALKARETGPMLEAQDVVSDEQEETNQD